MAVHLGEGGQVRAWHVGHAYTPGSHPSPPFSVARRTIASASNCPGVYRLGAAILIPKAPGYSLVRLAGFSFARSKPASLS